MVNSVSDRWVVVYDRSGRAVMRAKVDGGFRVDVETMKAGRVVERQSVWVDGATPMSQPATDDVQYVGGSTIHLPNGENYNLDAIAKAADKTEALQQQVTGLAVDLRHTRERVDQLETWLQRTRDDLVKLRDRALVGSIDNHEVIMPDGTYINLSGVAAKVADVPALREQQARRGVAMDQLRADVTALGEKTVAVCDKLADKVGVNVQAIDALRHEAIDAHENVVNAVNDLILRVERLERLHQQSEQPDADE